MTHRKLVLGLAAGLLALPMSAALAQTSSSGSSVDSWLPRNDRPFEPGFYVGAGAGYSWIDEDGFEDDRLGFKLYGGADVLSWLGAEIGYVNFGEFSDGGTDVDADGFSVAAFAQVPVGNFAPYLKVGHLWWDASSNAGDTDGDDWFGGLGVRFSLTEAVDMRVEYERYELDDADLDMGSLNVQYQF